MKPAYHKQRIWLNGGWSFAKESPQDFAPVEIPHDWLIKDTQTLYQNGVGYYRRMLDTYFLKAGQRLCLYFNGVYMEMKRRHTASARSRSAGVLQAYIPRPCFSCPAARWI